MCKAAGDEVDHSRVSSDGLNTDWSSNSTSLYALYGVDSNIVAFLNDCQVFMKRFRGMVCFND